MEQIELVFETRGKFHTLQFQLLNKDAMGSQPPLLKYPIPTVDELLSKLNNAKFCSCVYVYKGFTNIELDENSSFVTTMHYPIGRYRWLRMPFGLSLGPEEYQRRQL